MSARNKNITITRAALVKCIGASALISFCLGTQIGRGTNGALAQDDFLNNRKFTREETMLLNMTHAKGSVSFLLYESLRNAKESTRSIEKGLFQLREIEKSYAKSKGQPDTRYLAQAELKMVQAKQRSEDLELASSDAVRTLKASIKESLVQNVIPGK